MSPGDEGDSAGSREREPGGAPRRRRDLWIGLLIGLLCLVVYNANLRSIPAADTYGARYLPFALWKHHTVTLDPIAPLVAQGRKIARLPGWTNSAYWIVRGRNDHAVSLYPVVTPVVVAPLYLPAVLYLDARGWDPWRLDRVARVMEKLVASLMAAASAALLYLLLRRRTGVATAGLLTLAYAFGTTTWVISSQALWTHGLAELLIVSTLLLLTGPFTPRRAFAVGLLCGLVACNRPPDVVLAAALGCYGLWWAGRRWPLLVAGGAGPVALVLIYNLGVAGHVAGAYALVGKGTFFEHDLLSGLAGLLVSPTRGLFVFSPFLLVLLLGGLQVLRDRRLCGLTVAICIGVALQLLLYAPTDWRQGASWGPRWLTDCLPMLIWMLPPVIDRLSGAGRLAFGVACAVAMGLQAIGAFWYTGVSDAPLYAVVAGPDKMRAAWTPGNAPFVAELRHPPAPAELALTLRGHIDVAAVSGGGDASGSGDVTTGRRIDVEGWALGSGRSPSEVIVLLDGLPAGSTGHLFERPDVVKTLGYTEPSGWRVTIPLDEPISGERTVSVLVRARAGGDLRYLGERRLAMAADRTAPVREHPAAGSGADDDLARVARTAIGVVASRQQAAGYWLTSFTGAARHLHPGREMNTYLNAVMLDLLDPVATAAGLVPNLVRAREFLADQIEADGLVRYHGRPDAATIGTLGCAITPDADDTALTWRVAPGADPERLRLALMTLGRFRTPDGLYRTWLAPRDRYQCIDPGRDPNPADVGIQMHVLMLLAQANPAAARDLCTALGRAIDDDRIWVYYQLAPLLPLLRQADLERVGCPLRLPTSRSRTLVPGQEVWLLAARLLQRFAEPDGPAPPSSEVRDVLHAIAMDDFLSLRSAPPLVYHNDLSASVRRYYWSEELGYALWLRLYFEDQRRGSGGTR
ncbi:hypothetical protein CH341_12115 [Rhodoplanes roseus]|uniref:Glycosyltransferase RgtA/B/C/D-like domain-containing protein n=2 Tax=Rhodoplanes TaxID=29407 RepID=A0A327L0E6_9BRAD|nr:hypothetical protein CH341_12115 [Rhodoplanes roseus]